MLRKLRLLLLPFSWLYSLILIARNKAYDVGIKKSFQSKVYTICVGNLSMGGTGKSPSIEFLIKILKNKYQLATLSRGYKRNSKGFLEVNSNSIASEVGDEPLQFKRKFEEVKVAVDENRAHGIQKLTKTYKLDVILLDDAFQHRKVKPHFSLLLSVYNDLYSNDFVLPAGNLREPKSGAKRADVVVITKCPLNLSTDEQTKIKDQLQLEKNQTLFFSGIAYAKQVCSATDKTDIKNFNNFTLVTGIANPSPLCKHLDQLNKTYKHLSYPDHHNFSKQEIEELKKEQLILTTEKDFVRLKNHLNKENLYYLPIEMKLLTNEDKFQELILNSIEKHYEH